MLLLLLLLLLSLGGFQYSSAYYRLLVSRSVTVEEGLCTSIPCTFSYYFTNKRVPPSAIHGYWFKSSPETSDDDPVVTTDPRRKVKKWAKGRFHLVGDLAKDNCSLSITNVQRNDSGRYFFRMERGKEKYNYLYYQVDLRVTALTQKPDIYIPEILEPDRSVTLICVATWLCVESTNFTFSWMGASLSSGKSSRELPYLSVLTFIPKPQDHGTNLTCQLKNPKTGLSTKRTVQLNVAYPLKNIWISAEWENRTGLKSLSNASSHSIPKDENLRLLCQADSNPTAMLSWAHGGKLVLSSRPSDSGVLVLELPRLRPEDAGEYSCQAQHRLNTLHVFFNLTVLYAPENLRIQVWEPNRTVALLGNASSLVILVGQYLHLECAADSNPPGNMSWAKGNQLLPSSLLSSPGILGLKMSHIQPEDEGEYICQVQNPWGTSHIILNLSVEYPPRLFKSNCSWVDEGLFCTCSVQAEPTPSLIWWVGENRVKENSNNEILQVMSNTSGAWTNSSLILKGKLDLDLNLCCEGRNRHGAHSLIVLLASDRAHEGFLIFSKGTLLGVGITVLLILCFILIYKKLLRKKQIHPKEQGTADFQTNDDEVDYVNLEVVNELTQKQDRGPRPTPPNPVIQANPEELHYASLHFRRPKPQDNVKRQEADTEYSEIKY